jgi:hypothetical protein
MGQQGFWDVEARQAKLAAQQSTLERLNAVIPWEEFRPTLEQLHEKPRKSQAGRQPTDVMQHFLSVMPVPAILVCCFKSSIASVETSSRLNAWKYQLIEVPVSNFVQSTPLLSRNTSVKRLAQPQANPSKVFGLE